MRTLMVASTHECLGKGLPKVLDNKADTWEA